MAILETAVSAVSVGDLLAQAINIPAYQRPYSWTPAMALQLVDDLREAQATNPQTPYVLGAVILHKRDAVLDVVDGQQRLLTLRMILMLLEGDVSLSMDTMNPTPLIKVWRELNRALASLGDSKNALLRFINNRCQVVRIVTDDLDEAFRVFDSQNYRGKPLAPHDLLKAHHLREMQGESAAIKVAVVEAWESVKDERLARLFSTFLYRIVCWSRGESAPGFSVHNIGMFKGISHHARGRLSPCVRYHLAAQAAVPLLSNWVVEAGLNARDAGRCRFQLDAPLPAGRHFFEMVAFLIKELEELEAQAQSVVGRFGPSQHRYRYVYDLFIAALLYYTNKFGEENLDEATDRLFAWAYALRVELLRVQFASVDNRARGKDGIAPFTLLRNAMSSRVVRQLSTAHKPYGGEHEKALRALITSENA
ncbi:hypothetical protein C0J09_07245 [Bordetella avium]|uniref:DUF262 domain-containing protein n=1 Tax=Bordetella avium TaxID=521 RepID=UPI000FD854DB|nr:DUF262 domain-containing protein [Bordetella avium]AZY48957.1 hypothetical protein C0J09_07245 [Bordetella avium]